MCKRLHGHESHDKLGMFPCHVQDSLLVRGRAQVPCRRHFREQDSPAHTAGHNGLETTEDAWARNPVHGHDICPFYDAVNSCGVLLGYGCADVSELAVFKEEEVVFLGELL
jgi:hypothetical protein